MGLLLEAIQERGYQARFADARLARHQDDLPLAAFRLLPPGHEEIKLLLAAHQRCFAGAQRLEATLDLALPQNSPSTYRLGEAFDLDRIEVLILVKSRQEPACGLGNDHGARLCKRLEASGKIGRFAHDGLFLGGAGTDQIPNDNQPCGNTDADPKRFRGREPLNSVDERKPCLHGPLNVILTGARITEVHKHAVAHVFGNETPEARYGLGDARVISADHAA